MRFFYVAALLVPTILAADQAMQDSQDTQAVQVEGLSKSEALGQLIKKEVRSYISGMHISLANNSIHQCTDLPPNCVESLERLLNGAKKNLRQRSGRKNKECVAKITACAKKIGPKLAGGAH